MLKFAPSKNIPVCPDFCHVGKPVLCFVTQKWILLCYDNATDAVYRDFTIAALTKKKIIARLKFAGYIHNHKILPGNIFGLILKNKMAAIAVSLSVLKNVYIWLIIGPRGFGM